MAAGASLWTHAGPHAAFTTRDGRIDALLVRGAEDTEWLLLFDLGVRRRRVPGEHHDINEAMQAATEMLGERRS